MYTYAATLTMLNSNAAYFACRILDDDFDLTFKNFDVSKVEVRDIDLETFNNFIKVLHDEELLFTNVQITQKPLSRVYIARVVETHNFSALAHESAHSTRDLAHTWAKRMRNVIAENDPDWADFYATEVEAIDYIG